MARTQRERREGTRRALLDAATQLLVDEGYSRLTTTRVVELACLSQGALFKHFPTKLDLLAALAAELYDGLARDYRVLLQQDEGEPIQHAVTSLWEVSRSPRQVASYDLTVAARSDAALFKRIEPMVRQHRARIATLAQERSSGPASAWRSRSSIPWPTWCSWRSRAWPSMSWPAPMPRLPSGAWPTSSP